MLSPPAAAQATPGPRCNTRQHRPDAAHESAQSALAAACSLPPGRSLLAALGAVASHSCESQGGAGPAEHAAMPPGGNGPAGYRECDREGGQGWDQALTDFKAMLAEMSHSIHAQGETLSMAGVVPTTS